MKLEEIKIALPTMVVWMAQGVIIEGVKTYHKAKKQYNIEDNKKRSENITYEALWKLFSCCSAHCQKAIAIVAKERDGYCGYPEKYFDAFVNALETVQGYSVSIREKELINKGE